VRFREKQDATVQLILVKLGTSAAAQDFHTDVELPVRGSV
jgi:hypothetical protein